MVTAPGFKLDRRAVALRCKELQAKLNECPKKSKIGTGTLTIIVHRPDGDNEVAFDVVLYHGQGHEGPRGDRLHRHPRDPRASSPTSGGVRLSFDPLPEPPVIPGVEITYEFKGVSVRLGAKRKVVKRVGPRRKRRTFRHSLVSTPETCKGGSWACDGDARLPGRRQRPAADAYGVQGAVTTLAGRGLAPAGASAPDRGEQGLHGHGRHVRPRPGDGVAARVPGRDGHRRRPRPG